MDVSIQSVLSALVMWSRAIVDNRSLPRSVWQDVNTIKGHFKPGSTISDHDPGREIICPGVLYPQLVDFITYDQTDCFQAPHHIVLCCHANLETNSAALRYIFRKNNVDAIFSLRPEVGNVLTLPVA